jgi:hypothetical protein
MEMILESKTHGTHIFGLDDADWPLVSQYHWNIIKNKDHNAYYAHGYKKGIRRRDQKRIKLHQLIMGLNGPEVDHINRDGRDNYRENLRHIIHAGNMRNIIKPRKYNLPRGVELSSSSRYRARIRINGKITHLGMFDTIEAASTVYEAAAAKQFKKETII